ncbi:type II secretion system protein [Pseudothauera rhizosphaerae]|nr:type II secretion system protein [Pseudothauera rhizosphaerae]
MARGERGSVYLGLIFLVAILGTGLAAVGPLVQVSMQREREADLLSIGDEFRRAILTYYESSPGGNKRYPRTLEDLLEDRRHPVMRRHLRRIHRDPWSGEPRWGLVEAEDGGFKGVYSLAELTPLKHAGFPSRYEAFAQASRYSDWRFEYAPPSLR